MHKTFDEVTRTNWYFYGYDLLALGKTLEKGCKYLKIHTRLTNMARDHKLYVNFPSGIQSDIFSTSLVYQEIYAAISILYLIP